MSATPLFSVIVPTYNRLELLKQTLASIWAQSKADFEVIVVDDGSTDETLEYLRSLESKIEILRQTNRGPGAARNAGAKLARGAYLAFLDSDDVWFPWSLQVYQHVIERHGRPAFIAGKPYRFQNQHELQAITGGEVRGELFADYLASGDQWRWWGVSSFVIHRAAFLAVGGFADDWVNGEDADLALRLGVSPGFFQVQEPVTFGYREHAVSAMKDYQRTLAGAWSQVQAERAGRYPGGKSRSCDRRRILTRHVRPVTLSCVRQGFRRDAWGLYLATFLSNAAQGRVKYLTAFPFIALAHELLRVKIRS
jgi:glycosyltransferase involved in cell wall biosynthesis